MEIRLQAMDEPTLELTESPHEGVISQTVHAGFSEVSPKRTDQWMLAFGGGGGGGGSGWGG